jgi:hypothetical protein
MSPAHPIRIALMLLLALWGGFHLIGLLRVRDVPTLRRARLLAGLSGILLALALWSLATEWTGLPLALALGGLGCGAAWLTILYRQSLHNTTM